MVWVLAVVFLGVMTVSVVTALHDSGESVKWGLLKMLGVYLALAAGFCVVASL